MSGATGTTVGWVVLVGAGPGDPDLITVKGARALALADVVVYDRLVHPSLVGRARPDAVRIDVGKRPGDGGGSQQWINQTLIRHARAGKMVVRLKGGDPFVFGRGGEECAALGEVGIPFEVVPGVTSAVAGPAAAGIALTQRGVASSVAVVTAHAAEPGAGPNWRALAAVDTVVLMMGVESLAESADALIHAGKAPSTPAAVIQDATLPTQRVVRGPLSSIAARAKRAGIQPPAVTVVGEVSRETRCLAERGVA